MWSFIRKFLGLGVVAGLAVAAGCSSSDDSGSGGAGGASAGSGGKGGASSGTAGKGGSSAGTANGTAGSSHAGTGNNGNAGDNGGITEGGAGGAGGDTSAPNEAAGAGGADTGPKACNDLVFSGAKGTLTDAPLADAPTTFTYGALQAGNYRLTQATIYNQMTGSEPLGGLARVSVVGQAVTMDIYSTGDAFTAPSTETFQFTLGQPATMPPTNVKLTCATLGALAPFVGQDVTGQLKYSLTADGFSLYEVPFSQSYTFALITQ